MSLKWQAKTTVEIVSREIDWSGILLGDEIATSNLVVTSGGVVLSNIVNNLVTGLITLTVSGGTVPAWNDPYWRSCAPNTLYEAVLTNTITTVGGNTYVETIYQPLTTYPTTTAMPTGATKRAIIEMAFEEIGLDGYEFDPQPDEYSSALRRLDALMAEWAGPGNNLDLGYNFPPQFGQGDIADVAGIADFAVNTVALQLALRIAPPIGKTLSRETRVALTQGMIQIRTAYAVIPNRSLPRTTPVGSGNKPWWNVFASGSRWGC